MADEPVSPTGPRSDEDGSRLPVPTGTRVPAERAPAAVSVRRVGGLLIRAAAGAPLVAAAVAGAGAVAAVSGAAAVSRLVSPWNWVRGRSVPEDVQPSPARWPVPGVHVSYTHVEIRWRTVR
jgi:hypothetical protein